MKVEDFVNASINTLDNFDDFSGDATRLNPSALPQNLNKSGVPDTIVDSVVSADEPVKKFAEIAETILSLYEGEKEWVEVTDTQIASEIFNFRHSFIKGIVTEMNYTSYKMKCDDVVDVLDAGDIAQWENKDIQDVEESGIDCRVIYEGGYTDIQVKSSNSAAYRHRDKDNTEEDATVYPGKNSWNRLT